MKHPFSRVPVISGNMNEVRELLERLPRNTFNHIEEFLQRDEPYSISARYDPSLGENGVALIVKNSHLYGDSLKPSDNPVYRVPEGATNIIFTSVRLPPPNALLIAGVEFNYQDGRYFLGYEYYSLRDDGSD